MTDAAQRQRRYWDGLAVADRDAAVIDPRDSRGLKNAYLAGTRDQVFARTLADHGVERAVVLDLGAGTGSAALPLLMAGQQVLGVDISLGLLRHARQRCRAAGGLFVLTDGSSLPLRASCLDAAVVYVVLSYLVDDAAACSLLENLRVTLKPGAVLVMIEQVRVRRRYCEEGLKVQRSISEWKGLLQQAGFASVESSVVRHGRFPATPLIKLGLLPRFFWPAMRRLETVVGRLFGVLPWDYAEVRFVAVAP